MHCVLKSINMSQLKSFAFYMHLLVWYRKPMKKLNFRKILKKLI